jgi:hypothetical protein
MKNIYKESYLQDLQQHKIMMNLQEKRKVSEFKHGINKKMPKLMIMIDFRKRMKKRMSP